MTFVQSKTKDKRRGKYYKREEGRGGRKGGRKEEGGGKGGWEKQNKHNKRGDTWHVDQLIF